MRIASLHIRDFQGIYEAALDLADLTILYGPNGSGKSSVLDAIRHALTGDIRGDVLADVVRRGAKKATVEVMFGERTGIATETTAKGRRVTVDGVEIQTKEAAAALQTSVGVSVEAARAALSSGALLTMKPDARLSLLAAITGAKFDRASIAKELGEFDPMPGSLAELRAAADRAVEARKDAKRRLAIAEEDYGHVPPIDPAIAAKARSEADVTARIQDLQRRRDAALVAGADPARLAVIEASIEKYGARRLPVSDLSDASRRLVRAESAVADAKARVRELEIRAGATGGPSLADAAKAVESARAEASAATKALDLARAEYTRRAAIVEAVKAGGCCDTCGQALTAGLLQTAKESLESAAMDGKTKAQEAEAARVRLAAAEQALIDAQKGEVGRKAAADLPAAKAAVIEAEAAFAAQEAEFRKSSAAQEAARAHNALLEEKIRLRTPSGENVTLLDAEILELRAVQSAFKPLADAARLKKRIADEQAAIVIADTAEKRCLAARDSIIAKAIGPFVKAANDALAAIAPGLAVEVTPDVEVRVNGMTVEQLSDGERTRVLYALQLAVTRLAGVKLLVLDRVELIDDAGRGALKKFAATCAAEGIQVVMLTCAAAPAAMPAGVAAYRMDNGRAERIGTKAAA